MESDAEDLDYRQLVSDQNRKKKKSGGFQSMGLSQPIFRGVIAKGYKIPTPIQRKCIPILLNGQDVVAMARTGSGKTAAFLIPLFERLKKRAVTGARALILSPTRELALQTEKFFKEIGKFVGLRSALILGGNTMDEQFSAMHENPDVIIATPGRFLHVIMEMGLKLNSVEYVVFDEADRLFEMGFAEQLQEILRRLPENRQTLLFSATLPKLMADFAKAGLNDPTLIRLDVDSKLSENLKLSFIHCRSEDKLAALLQLLRSVISKDELTILFVATKHHVEYMQMILESAGISTTYLYSSLDHLARKINVTKFQSKAVRVLITTDLAARGIDIPILDNVINFSFPTKPKLFVHRVGRVARAGRSGVAHSIVSPEETPYVLDLHLFLGRNMKYAENRQKISDWDGYFGSVPRRVIDEVDEELRSWHSRNIDLVNMKKVCSNAYMRYLKSCPHPSTESIRRMKEDFQIHNLGTHPLFASEDENEIAKNNLLQQMKSYKPNSTIFEINTTVKKQGSVVMREFRKKNSQVVERHHKKMSELNDLKSTSKLQDEKSSDNADTADVDFNYVIEPSKNKGHIFKPKNRKRKASEIPQTKDSEFYVPYKPSDHHLERGLEVDKGTFNFEASDAVLDFTGDEIHTINRSNNQQKWDRKKKKFVNVTGKESKVKKIKTESGVWIPASYKTDLYKKWQKKSKIESMEQEDGDDSEGETQPKREINFGRKKQFNKRVENSSGKRKPRRELKTKEEIFKQRQKKGKMQAHQKKRFTERMKRKSRKN